MKPNLSSPFTLGISVFAAVSALTQTEPQAPDSTEQGLGSSEIRVAERGQDFAVYQRITAVTRAEGFARFRTNEWTLLENGLHFFDAETGDWQPSRDLIESFPEGAIARYGPVRAIFSHDLNSESVFDLETPEGARLRGGVRALEWYDEATGQRVTLATVKALAPIELVPPNRLVARDAFDGVLADVILEWRHNRFGQSVVLREQPLLPESLDPVTTRLAVITEFVEAPEPEINRVIAQADGQAQAEDHVTISFEGVSILLGHAFAVGAADGEAGLSVGTIRARDQAVPVRKTWEPLPGGGGVLVESISLAATAPLWEGLPRQARAEGGSGRDWRTTRIDRTGESRPVEFALSAYQPAGVIVDFELVPSCGSGICTLRMGKTYYVHSSYYMGPGAIHFEPGCTVKLNNNAYVLVYGPLTFPNTLQTPVFTSHADDGFGEDIDGIQGSVPTHHANPALWVYYVNFSTTVKNSRFRWAKMAVRYDGNPGVTVPHYVQNSLFENCQKGIQNSTPGSTIVLSGVEMQNVHGPVSGPYQGSYSAPLFYMNKSFPGISGNDADNPVSVADPMGAVGPAQYLEVLNGRIAIFNPSTGTRLSELALNTFFAPGEGRNMADPRVWYDHASQRWVTSAMDQAADTVIVKVSLTNSPGLDSASWRRYVVAYALATNESVDFPTLGIDANGVYFSVQVRPFGGNGGFRIQAFRKPDVYTNPSYQPPAPLVITAAELNTWCIQPAYNFDASPVYAWFVAKGPSSGNNGGQLYYRPLQWTGNNPTWAAGWQILGDPVPGYRDYYDIPQDGSLSAPQNGGPAIRLGDTGSRLMTAVIRSSYLWTCHHVGLDGTDGDYDGPTPDRSAVQWFKLKVDNSTLFYNTHGRIYDTASNDPYWYHFPSMNVNAAGDLVAGFSGSKTTEHIGAFFHARKSNGTWMTRPTLIQSGRAGFSASRWGDYSATGIDPNDGSFWTVQEHAGWDPDPVFGGPVWSTWINQVVAP